MVSKGWELGELWHQGTYLKIWRDFFKHHMSFSPSNYDLEASSQPHSSPTHCHRNLPTTIIPLGGSGSEWKTTKSLINQILNLFCITDTFGILILKSLDTISSDSRTLWNKVCPHTSSRASSLDNVQDKANDNNTYYKHIPAISSYIWYFIMYNTLSHFFSYLILLKLHILHYMYRQWCYSQLLTDTEYDPGPLTPHLLHRHLGACHSVLWAGSAI